MIVLLGAIWSKWSHYLPQLLPGLLVSLKVTGLSLGIGLPLGVAFGSATNSTHRWVRWPIMVLVEIGRGPPTLVIIYLAYFGLPRIGLTLDAFWSAVVALAYNTGAYVSEIYRGGLLAVPHGQREAARAVGLRPFDQFRYVIFPQAARVAIPPTVSFAILVFQASSLCFVIAVPELLSRAYNIGTVTFDTLGVLCLAGLIYAAIAVPSSQLVNHLERRVARRL